MYFVRIFKCRERVSVGCTLGSWLPFLRSNRQYSRSLGFLIHSWGNVNRNVLTEVDWSFLNTRITCHRNSQKLVLLWTFLVLADNCA